MKLESTLITKPGMGYIAPLLDVVMLLLIFFLLSSQFIQRSGFAVDLPFSRSTLESLAAADVITLPTGTVEQVLLNDRRVPISALGADLKARVLLDRQIVIRADKATPLGRLVNIINIARDAGFKDIAVMTSPEPE
ncbi:MAG: biopolymer transport protein ExbD [Verrucomicrobiales bacterium]|jgi:biopolymer transport protein ExbD